MSKEQILMGSAITVVSLVGLWKSRWFVANTAKGRTLVHFFGPTGGVVVVQAVLVMGLILGLLLATDLVRPMQW